MYQLIKCTIVATVFAPGERRIGRKTASVTHASKALQWYSIAQFSGPFIYSDGDRQADLAVYGGSGKAAYVYPAEYYAWWHGVRTHCRIQGQ
jgi:MOSC domain-containing protein YiiM